MGKYALVASNYDFYKGTYENEQVIKMVNIDLTNLIEIDKFTASHTKDDLIAIIRKENNISNDINTLSIRYYKNATSTPSYYHAIIDNKVIMSILNKVKMKSFNDQKKRFAYGIDVFDETFVKEKRKLIELIETRNTKEINRLIPDKSDLKNLINRYFNSNYDNQSEQLETLTNIVLEFSRYKTFRGWIVANNKKYEKHIIKETTKKTKIFEPKIEHHTIEEIEQKYEKNFNQENNITYQERMVFNYNTRNLDDDKEEFIEPDELDQMGYTR